MRPAISGCRAMLSRAEAPMRGIAAPRPAPTPAPENVVEFGSARAGAALSSKTTITRQISFRTFMEGYTPFSKQQPLWDTVQSTLVGVDPASRAGPPVGAA